MTDDDVRDMLQQRAAGVQPSADGLERIKAKLDGEVPVTAGRSARRVPVPWLAAAAVLVVALVGAVLFIDRDDSTNVAVGPNGGPSGGFTSYPLGVWPWPGDHIDDSIMSNPELAATAYVGQRVGVNGARYASIVDGDRAQVTFTGDVSTEVFLRKAGDTWYVERSTSDLVTLHDAGDGTTTARVETGGVLLRQTALSSDGAEASGTPQTVQGGEEYPGLGYDLGRDDVAKRELFVLDTGDGTIALTEVAFTPPPFSEALEAVWPSNDPDVLNGISASWARDDSPLPAVKSYLTNRVGEVGLTDEDVRIVMADGAAQVTVTGPIATVIDVRRLDGDGPWYVRGATSGLIGMGNVTFDGRTVHTSVLPGVDGNLDVSATAPAGVTMRGGGGSQTVVAEEQAETSFSVGDSVVDAPAVVVTTVLRNGDVVALDDRLVQGPPSERVGTTTTVVASPTTNDGVWPKANDHIDDETLSDPVKTAARYLEETVGSTESTVLSDFRRGDTTSGEIEVSGDITGTILLRELDGHWQVEAVISDLVESIEGAPGEVRLIAKEDGVLSILALDADGNVVTSMPNGGVVAGQETLVVPNAPDGTPLTVRWKLQTPMDAQPNDDARTAIGDVSLYGGAYSEHAVPEEAIFAEGGLDARETASRYLASRLGGRTVTVNADATIDGDHAEVSWEAGLVELVKSDDDWYVTEAIGDSIQIEDSKHFRVAQAGTIHVTIGDKTFDLRNDVDREGTIVDFDHDIPDPFVLRAVFETDTGFVSLAERAFPNGS
jgi:hypothetical protein